MPLFGYFPTLPSALNCCLLGFIGGGRKRAAQLNK
jgi:hypothetical protein